MITNLDKQKKRRKRFSILWHLPLSNQWSTERDCGDRHLRTISLIISKKQLHVDEKKIRMETFVSNREKRKKNDVHIGLIRLTLL